jgi:hypothetical protein
LNKQITITGRQLRLHRMDQTLVSGIEQQHQEQQEPDADVGEPTEVKRQKLDSNQESDNNNKEPAQTKTIKKRKYALCLGYSGYGYYGLQR